MEKVQGDSLAMENRLSNQINFTSFIADFTSWARDKEGQLTQELAQVINELEELNEKLERLTKAIIGLGGGGLALVLSQQQQSALGFWVRS